MYDPALPLMTQLCLLFAVECRQEYLGHSSLCVLCLHEYLGHSSLCVLSAGLCAFASEGATLQLTA